MDETPGHRRAMVDTTGWHAAPLGLVVDGRTVRLGAESIMRMDIETPSPWLAPRPPISL